MNKLLPRQVNQGGNDMRSEIKKEFIDLRNALGLANKKPCTDTQNKEYTELLKTGKKLPNGVFQYYSNDKDEYVDKFYVLLESDMTSEEMAEYIGYKQMFLLAKIKGYLEFFVVLTVISLVLSIIGVIAML